MANLQEESVWSEGIRQLEIEPALGGPDGAMNIAPRQLTNRTKFLKTALTEAVEDAEQTKEAFNAALADVKQDLNGVIGRGGFIDVHDFGDPDDTGAYPTRADFQDALTEYALQETKETDPLEIYNGTKVTNSWNGNVWQLTNTPDTDPPVFDWADRGPDSIADATAEVAGKSKLYDTTEGEHTDGSVTQAAIKAGFAKKVEKVENKQLSTEDYTTSEKTKLAGIAAGAQVNPAVATEAEAAAGTNTTKIMTPQRVKNALDAFTPGAILIPADAPTGNPADGFAFIWTKHVPPASPYIGIRYPDGKEMLLSGVLNLAVINPSAKDIGVKFGMAAPASGRGYTPAQVRQILEAVHMAALAGTLSSFAVGDYFDLDTLSTPTVTVKDAGDADMEFLAESLTNTALTNANYTGYTEGAQLRFHIESIDGYLGKNGNTGHHIVFRSWGKFYGNKVHGDNYGHYGRMNNSNITTGGWAASGAKKFLNGAFLDALEAAGIPSEYLMDTKRTVSVSTSAAEIDVSKVFLPTEWEEFGARSYAPTVENDGTQIKFGTTPNGNGMVHIKYPLNNMNTSDHYGHHWLSSVYSGANFCAVNTSGSAYNRNASYAPGFAPAFCVA
jgi:hypothetical protein